MYLIIGLGNPTKQYEKTRHNIGFDVIDALAEKYNISVTEKKHKALFGKGVIEGQKVVLAKLPNGEKSFLTIERKQLYFLCNLWLVTVKKFA